MALAPQPVFPRPQAPLPSYQGSAPAERPVLRPRRSGFPMGVLVFGLCWLAVVAVAVLLVHRQAKLSQVGWALEDLNGQIVKVEIENQQLVQRVAQLKALDRIEHAAVTRLGMVRPKQVRIATIDRPVLQAKVSSAPAAPAPAKGPPSVVTEMKGLAQGALVWLERVRDFTSQIRLGPSAAEARTR